MTGGCWAECAQARHRQEVAKIQWQGARGEIGRVPPLFRQRGAATVLVAALLAVATVLGLLLTDFARMTVARATAVAAADAAALAAAPLTFAVFGVEADPMAAAVKLAEAHGTELLECRCSIDRSWAAREVLVVVALDVELLLLTDRRVEAASAAEFRPILLGLE